VNLPQNINTFLKQFPIKEMRGEEIFASMTFYLANGKKKTAVEVKDIKGRWSKTFLGKIYNPAFANRAQGWVDSYGRGKVCLTDEGIEYLESLVQPVSSSRSGLTVFKKGSTHSFDKFLRSIFKKVTKNVDIADTYVAGNIFDSLLDEIPNTIPIRLLYGRDVGGFVTKSTRFAKQYSFQGKESKQFHDRFLIVDGKGYIIGPSLKDAADKKPATMVALNDPDSQKLANLFTDLWG